MGVHVYPLFAEWLGLRTEQDFRHILEDLRSFLLFLWVVLPLRQSISQEPRKRSRELLTSM